MRSSEAEKKECPHILPTSYLLNFSMSLCVLRDSVFKEISYLILPDNQPAVAFARSSVDIAANRSTSFSSSPSPLATRLP